MKCFHLLLFGVLLASAWCSGAENQATDEQMIRRTLSAFNDARNAFDARAIADLFTLDGEFTSPTGNTHKGRPAIRKFFATVFQSPEMKTSRSTRTVRRLRFLGSDVAVADVTGDLSTRAGTIRVLEVCLMTKQNKGWFIASIYHMHLVDDSSTAGRTRN